MDPLTHALSGALAVRATARSKGPSLRQCLIAGTAAALFPDVDFALRLIDTLTYLNLHQGVTHSILALPLWAVLLSWLFAAAFGKRKDWPLFLLPVSIGLATHIVGDLMTAYGLQLFAPLSGERHATGLAYVVDPFIMLILITGALLCWRWPQRRSMALVPLAVLCAYMGFLAQQHQKATAFATAHAVTAGISPDSIDVLPQPFSPFNWLLAIREDDTLQVSRVNLRHLQAHDRRTSSLPGLAGRMDEAHGSGIDWQHLHHFGSDPINSGFARHAWQQEAFAPFRRFARLPVLTKITEDGGKRCAWFADLRFDLPVLGPSFRFAACQRIEAPDEWEVARARGRFWLD